MVTDDDPAGSCMAAVPIQGPRARASLSPPAPQSPTATGDQQHQDRVSENEADTSKPCVDPMGGRLIVPPLGLTCIPMEDRGVFRYSSALDTSTALSQVSTELWLSVDGCLFPAMTPAASMAMVTALVLSRLSVEL
ncbi:hypothetical protein EYF80_006611 [Liparis tanakae]|uniref:Uncharacterized protein n=1 Tax=Liparis tanakae TaxID=230148 RepID=A0A4Z2IZM1_9TELE|nr:hypothetical protein EYF80_006611 [Liparis tanakae]